jgi:hypothetical protein
MSQSIEELRLIAKKEVDEQLTKVKDTIIETNTKLLNETEQILERSVFEQIRVISDEASQFGTIDDQLKIMCDNKCKSYDIKSPETGEYVIYSCGYNNEPSTWTYFTSKGRFGKFENYANEKFILNKTYFIPNDYIDLLLVLKYVSSTYCSDTKINPLHFPWFKAILPKLQEQKYKEAESKIKITEDDIINKMKANPEKIRNECIELVRAEKKTQARSSIGCGYTQQDVVDAFFKFYAPYRYARKSNNNLVEKNRELENQLAKLQIENECLSDTNKELNKRIAKLESENGIKDLAAEKEKLENAKSCITAAFEILKKSKMV